MWHDNIRSLEKARGITRQELADRMGTSLNQLYLLETGRTNPRLSSLEKLAAALGCTLVVSIEPVNQQDG